MRPRALHGQKKGSLFARWPTCSPRMAFFWSSNMRVEERIRCVEFESFKGASGAQQFMSLMVRWMCRNNKDWVRASGVCDLVHSAGHSSQK